MLKARISKILYNGTLEIEFNMNMSTEGLNLTELNSSVAEIYLKPNKDWHFHTENFSISSLNFTWKTISYSNTTLQLFLNFTDPLAISPKPIYDQIFININDTMPSFREFFVSKSEVELHRNYTVLSRSIPKQVYDIEFNV